MKMCDKCGAVVNPKTDVCDACEGTGKVPEHSVETPVKKKKR